MKLHNHPHITFRNQDEESVKITLAFRGKKNRDWYRLNINIPKNKLKNIDGEAADGNSDDT